MASQGRRGGSPRRRTSDTAGAAQPPALSPTPAVEPEPAVIPPAAAETAPDAELLDERTVPIAGGRRGSLLGRSLPGAMIGSLLVVGLAFGAAAGPGGAFGPKADTTPKADAAGLTADSAGAGSERRDGTGGDGPDAGYDNPLTADHEWGGEGAETDQPSEPDPTKEPEPKPDPTKQPAPEATKQPAPEATKKPEPKPEPTKEPVDDPDPIALALAIKEGHPFMEWGSCGGLDFDYYKVVRSKDATVTWPAGEHDSVIAAVERGGTRKAYDKDAPHGRKAWYRVFCVRKTDAGYKVVNASAAKGIEVPEENPPPDPISLGLQAHVTDEGKVVLSWDACEVDGFGFYKVVRSTWNDNPSYLPWTDGSEVIGVVEGMHDTEWHDWAPEAGETVYYRVQCLGYSGDHKVLLGQTAVVAVTGE